MPYCQNHAAFDYAADMPYDMMLRCCLCYDDIFIFSHPCHKIISWLLAYFSPYCYYAPALYAMLRRYNHYADIIAADMIAAMFSSMLRHDAIAYFMLLSPCRCHAAFHGRHVDITSMLRYAWWCCHYFHYAISYYWYCPIRLFSPLLIIIRWYYYTCPYKMMRVYYWLHEHIIMIYKDGDVYMSTMKTIHPIFMRSIYIIIIWAYYIMTIIIYILWSILLFILLLHIIIIILFIIHYYCRYPSPPIHYYYKTHAIFMLLWDMILLTKIHCY